MNGQLVKRKLDNKTVAFDSGLAFPKGSKIFFAQYFPCRLIGDDLDIIQSTTHGQPFDWGQSEPWKGAEHSEPHRSGCSPSLQSKGELLPDTLLAIPDCWLGTCLWDAEPTHQTSASSIWRQHTHTLTHPHTPHTHHTHHLACCLYLKCLGC